MQINTKQPEQAEDSAAEPTRTVVTRNTYDVPMTSVIQDSNDALLPSTSKDQLYLIGYQDDPQLTQHQKEQQQAAWEATKAAIDLRDVLNRKERVSKLEQLAQKKRDRELVSSGVPNVSPTPSPT